MAKYVFKEDEILTIKAKDRADPDKIGKALESIAAKAGGHLQPQAVVDAASERKSVLHRHFEWDDAKAALSFRLDQARSLIRSIHLEGADTDSGVARAFLSIKDREGTSYRHLSEIMASADLQLKLLASAERDLLAFEGRYKSLTDICDLVRSARERIANQRSKHESRAQA